jgi:AcrR family transcriptional regulator
VAALDLLDEVGLDALSLRRVAERLNVRVNTVAWHAGDKAALLRAMADRLMATCLQDPPPTDPEERARALMRRFRRALLSRRDGARLAADGFSFTAPHTMALAEAVTAALLETGRSPREVAWTGRTLIHFATGFARDEQEAPDRSDAFRAANVDPSRFPAVAQTVAYLGEEDADARFEYGLQLILSGSGQPPTSHD